MKKSLDPSVDLSSTILIANAPLAVKLWKTVHFFSEQKFASDIYATENCSKLIRPPYILYKTIIPVDSEKK